MKKRFILALLLLLGVPLVAVAEQKTEVEFVKPRKPQLIKNNQPVVETIEVETSEEVETVKENSSGSLSVQQQATQDAHTDVENYINKPMWFFIGCVFPGVGLLTPFFYTPPAPTGRIIGKSAEYTAFYTEAYQRKMQALQFQTALGGCLTTGGVWCLLGVMSGFAGALQ